jgi:hypothetical protein
MPPPFYILRGASRKRRSRMARNALARLLIALSLAAPLPAAAGGRPALPRFDAIYDLYIGGLWLGDVTVNADFEPAAYKAQAAIRLAGLIGLFYHSELVARAEGRVDGAGLSPEHFSFDSVNNRKRQFVNISYRDGTPASLSAEPEYPQKPWSIDAADQHGVADPLSAGLTAFTPAPADEICGQRVEIFDGRRRFALDIKPPEREDGKITCKAEYIRLAGFGPREMRPDEARWQLMVYLDQRPDGLYQIYRVTTELRLGVGVLKLRKK